MKFEIFWHLSSVFPALLRSFMVFDERFLRHSPSNKDILFRILSDESFRV